MQVLTVPEYSPLNTPHIVLQSFPLHFALIIDPTAISQMDSNDGEAVDTTQKFKRIDHFNSVLEYANIPWRGA